MFAIKENIKFLIVSFSYNEISLTLTWTLDSFFRPRLKQLNYPKLVDRANLANSKLSTLKLNELGELLRIQLPQVSLKRK